jgi:hypothetical protein
LSRLRGPVLALLLASLPASPAPAQVREGQLFGGVESRSLRFDGLPVLRRLRQTVVPVGAVIPAGRFTFDLGSSWASTRMDRLDGTSHSVDAFTDTQVRGAVVIGREVAVATVLVNLPTGLDRASPRDYTVIGAISPGLLGFPVASYASGFSVTTGLAGAVQTGNWSMGLAASFRLGSEFTPYADAEGPITYKPGVEGRVRAGLDGVIGQSRLSAGVTYSTFGDDHFGQSGALRGEYRPGPRWVAEAALLAPVGSSTLELSAWHFRRSAGDSTGSSARNRENLTGAEALLSIPLAHWIAFEPALMGRRSNPQAGSASMWGVGAGFRLRLAGSLSLSPSMRFDRGEIEDPAGNQVDLRGWYFSAFVRWSP